MKHLYFVRHGLSVMNVQGLRSSVTDTPLTPEGEEQAREAGRQLKDAGIDCIVASPLKRTFDTARLIAEQIGYPTDKIITHELFLERDFGPLENTMYDPNTPLDDTEGVEHSDDVVARAAEGMEFLRSLDAESIVVVSHGALGRALRAVIEPDGNFHVGPRFDNAEVAKLL